MDGESHHVTSLVPSASGPPRYSLDLECALECSVLMVCSPVLDATRRQRKLGHANLLFTFPLLPGSVFPSFFLLLPGHSSGQATSHS